MALKKLFLPLLVITLVVAVTFFTQKTIKSQTPPLKEQSLSTLQDKIPTLAECREMVDQNQMQTAKECFTTEFKNAWEAKNFRVFNESLTEQLHLNERAFQPCHDAGHEAGYKLLTKDMINESVVVLALNEDNACDNGFIHGLFDAVGNKEGITVENWWDLAKGCNNLLEISQRNLCGDGSGHGAFQLTHDIVTALTLCANHPSSYTKDACMQGVFMQIVRPDHDQNYPPVIDPSELESKWLPLCKSLQKENLNKDFAYNCEIILSKLLAHQMTANTINWGRDNGIHDQKIQNYLKKAAPNAIKQCDKLSAETMQYCQEDLALMSIYISQNQKDLKIIYCQNLPQPLQPKCLSAGANRNE